MARILMTGFEAGHIGVLEAGGGSPSVNASVVRTGTYSAYIGGNYTWLQKTFASTYSEIYARFGLYPTASMNNRLFFMLLNIAEAATHGSLTTDSSLRIQARRGNESGTILGTATTPLTLTQWHCIELHWLCHDTTGVFQVKVNGTLEIDLTNVDTRNGGTTATIDQLRFGGTGLSHYLSAYWDDIAINDTSGSRNNSWIGQGGIRVALPTGAGTHTEWTPSAGSNYACVDERPPNDDTDYVTDDTPGQRDLYAMGNMGITGSVSAVQWVARARLSAASGETLKRLMRQDSVDYSGSAVGLDLTYKFVQEVLDAAPDGTDWSVAKVDAIEAGVEVG